MVQANLQETVFERFVALLRLPYGVSCLLLTLFLGIPGTLLTRYLDTFDIAQTFSIPGFVTGSERYWRAVGFYWIGAYAVFFFYLFYFIRYFRTKLVDAKVRLSPLLAAGDEAYQRAFRVVLSPYGALATSAIIMASFAPTVYRMILSAPGIISSVHVVISQVVLYFAGGTGIWLFFSSIWSLRKLAKESIKVLPSSEDPLLGLGPIGSISLAMALIYFGAVGLRGFTILASGVETAPIVVNVLFELVLSILGLIVFLLTINVFHIKMVEQKRLEKEFLHEQRRKLLESSANKQSATEYAASQNAESMLMIEVVERRVRRIHTWPFGTGVLSSLSAILLSVVSITVARVIQIVLHI